MKWRKAVDFVFVLIFCLAGVEWFAARAGSALQDAPNPEAKHAEKIFLIIMLTALIYLITSIINHRSKKRV